ncbi:hypothetical protein K438DRAFT_1765196 [Mycena galopus ATCC 62051]|nr:hypothetical protein K438DRAFT_1765196 [Mycena galopus ATCC 62051]
MFKPEDVLLHFSMSGGNGGSGGPATGDGGGGHGGNGEGPRLIDQLVVHQLNIFLGSSQQNLLRDLLASSIPANSALTASGGSVGTDLEFSWAPEYQVDRQRVDPGSTWFQLEGNAVDQPYYFSLSSHVVGQFFSWDSKLIFLVIAETPTWLPTGYHLGIADMWPS